MLHNRKTRIGSIIVLLILLAIGAGVAAFFLLKQEVSKDEPVDVVFDFYRPWLEAVQSTSTDPYQAGLDKWPFLGRELRGQIRAARGVEGGLDPVLCQTVTPEDFALRVVFEGDAKSEMVVTARKSSSTQQAIVSVLAHDGGWYIDDIRCSPGEIPPEREFSFDAQGTLAKSASASSTAPWHLTFAENGETGKDVPLFFGPESVCAAADGTAVACVPDSFTEKAKVRVRGEMTELGVTVVRMESVR